MPPKHQKTFLKRLFSLEFTRKLILYAILGLFFVLGVFVLLRFFPEKAFEFSSPYFGTIKATANSASNYLADIQSISHRIEGQRDTIDAAFANAAAAQRASSNANEQVDLAQMQLEIMKTNADFLQLMTRAYADDRVAFDRLVDLRFSSNPEISKSANNVVNMIVNLLDINFKLAKNNLTANWKGIGIEPSTNSLQQLEFLYPFETAGAKKFLLEYIATSERFPKAERLDFVIKALQDDSSLSIKNQACEIMNDESGLGKNILGAPDYITWWKNNRLAYAITNNSVAHP